MRLVFRTMWRGFYEHGRLVLVVVLWRRKGPVPPRRSLIAGSRSTIQVQNMFSSQLTPINIVFLNRFSKCHKQADLLITVPGIHTPPTQTAVFHVMLSKLLLIIRILVRIPSLVLRPEKVLLFVENFSSLKKGFMPGFKIRKICFEAERSSWNFRRIWYIFAKSERNTNVNF